MAMKLYILMENEKHEGGSPRGVYTTLEKAEEEKGRDWGVTYWSIVPVEVDQPQDYLEPIRPS